MTRTEREHAAQRVSRYQVLAERARDIILFVEADSGRIVEANDAAAEAYGYSRAELLERCIQDLRAPETIGDVAAQMSRADLEGVLFETLHCRRDGTTFPVEVSSKGAVDSDRRVLLSIVRDITERKESERALRSAMQATQDLRDRQRELLELELERRTALWLHAERLATLGTLASAVGHELNNVNTVFLSYLKFVRDRAAKGLPPEPEDLETIVRMTDHLRMHARHLLSLGRPGPDTIVSVDLGELADSVATMLQSIGRLKHARVAVHRLDARSTVRANRARLEQVLINVLGNAADAVAQLGNRERAVDVFVRTTGNPGAERVVVTVRDNGSGIPSDLLSRVFEPYFTTKPAGSGSGLGLVVVRQIVESLGGSVGIESRVDEETLVTLDFPADR